MLAGVIAAGYTLPGSTRLAVFLMVSGAWFVVGNVLLLQKIKRTKGGTSPAETGPWPHLFRAFAVLFYRMVLGLIALQRLTADGS